MVSPSGLSDGTSSSTTLLSRRWVSASPARARSYAHSIAIWLEAISLEWMLQVTSTMALPLRASASTCASVKPRGSASLRAVSRIESRFFMFASDEMTAMISSSPRVVLPSDSTCTRGELAASARKYDAICL